MGEPSPKLTKLTSNPEILRIIECPVCHEIPFPPIYQCMTGHNICKLCKPKLLKCPMCENRITDKRNYSVEHMVLASTHTCAYGREGCKIEGTGEVLGDHLKICKYRSFMCPGNGNKNNCPENISIQLSQAREHFLVAHKSFKTDSRRTFSLAYTVVAEDHSKLKEDAAWPPSLIEFDGKSFLGHVYIRNDIFYWTIFCIGTEEGAGKYKAEITFSSNRENGIRIQWTVPVQPIIKCEQLRDGNGMKDVLIPCCNFSDFKKAAVRDDDKSTYIFHTEYKILKCKSE